MFFLFNKISGSFSDKNGAAWTTGGRRGLGIVEMGISSVFFGHP
jgi:hypothetical protein